MPTIAAIRAIRLLQSMRTIRSPLVARFEGRNCIWAIPFQQANRRGVGGSCARLANTRAAASGAQTFSLSERATQALTASIRAIELRRTFFETRPKKLVHNSC